MTIFRKVVQHRSRRRHGDRKPDPGALVRPIVRRDHRVDPDHLPARVHQWAAAVARVDRRIRLDRVIDRIAIWSAHASNRGDDAARHRARKAKRIHNGKHLLSHHQIPRVRQFDRLQVGRIDLQERQVVHLVHADHLRLVFVFVVELYFNAAVVLSNHVVVRQDMSLLV